MKYSVADAMFAENAAVAKAMALGNADKRDEMVQISAGELLAMQAEITNLRLSLKYKQQTIDHLNIHCGGHVQHVNEVLGKVSGVQL